MEAKLAEKSLSCNRQMRNSKVRAQNHPFYHHRHQQQQQVARYYSNISRQNSSDNIVQLEKIMLMHGHGHGNGGVFLNPTVPFSLSSSLSLPPIYQKNTQVQPPLLPLPITKPIFHSLPLSPPKGKQTNKKTTTTASMDLAFTNSLTLAETNSKRKQTNKTKPKSPNPKPKLATTKADREKQPPKDVLIYSLSPPPSSLPLPKFSLRQQPKLSCTVEAAVAGDHISDDGATENIRRMLRLR